MRSDGGRLKDILSAIDKIEQRKPGRLDSFSQDEMLQVWIVHHLQVIGEAGRGISSKLRDRHPDVPWAQIVALRNILVHEYFGLDLDQVWTMVERDLPKLQGQIQSILSQEEPGAK